MPEETLNVLITVMSEGELHVPRLGRLVAAPGFRLVSAMNPFDAIGTARISGAVYDRVCRLAVGYQSADDEAQIARREAAVDGVDPTWVARVVELVRSTRSHPDLRVGSSVRGAIDMCAVASTLAPVRGQSPDAPERVARRGAGCAVGPRAAPRGRQPVAEDVIRELWESVFGRAAGGDGVPEGKAGAPTGATTSP